MVKSPTKGTKNARNVALNRLWKGHVFTAWELKQEGRASSHLTSAGNVGFRWLRLFTMLHMSTNDRESTSTDSEVPNKFYQLIHEILCLTLGYDSCLLRGKKLRDLPWEIWRKKKSVWMYTHLILIICRFSICELIDKAGGHIPNNMISNKGFQICFCSLAS